MNISEKMEFVEELGNAVTSKLLHDISSGKIPEDWNGIELRALLAERFNRSTYGMSRKQKADYNNAVIVNNL